LTTGRIKGEYKRVDTLFPIDPAPTLVGIARAAASSPLLESKRRIQYLELPTKSYIARCASKRVPFDWTINPYRGCEFGCKYCYARYTHEFMELRDGVSFETKIFAKQWDQRAFSQELRRIARRDWIAIGTATDPYQPAERRFRITREILTLLAREKGRRFSITTKSDLVSRDLDLLTAISQANILYIAVTITTVDENLARLMEPFAPRPALRLKAVQSLAKARVKVGVLASPILPSLNDAESSLDRLAAAAKRAGANYFGGHVVFLKPCTHQVFFPFLEQHFPHLLKKYQNHFRRNPFLSGAYSAKIEAILKTLRSRYALGERFPEYKPSEWEQEPQMELPLEMKS
jgi:DNA repair photolyase